MTWPTDDHSHRSKAGVASGTTGNNGDEGAALTSPRLLLPGGHAFGFA
jgi:hypothetical protein